MFNFKAHFDMVNVEIRKSGRFYRILNIIDILERHGNKKPLQCCSTGEVNRTEVRINKTVLR